MARIGASGLGNGSYVTSVGLADASTIPIYTVSGSPVTSTGNLTLTLAIESANLVFAGPTSGSAAQPTFRALSSTDIPSLNYVTSVSVISANGFTGSVATPTTTPAITLSTTVTGLIQGNGTAMSAAALTGDVTNTAGSLATTISANVVTNAKLAQMPADTIKGNNTASIANALDLTAAQVTAMLPVFIGDVGSGGVQGLVPAPPIGSKAAGDFLSANGTWTYIDQSNTISPSFSLVDQAAVPSGSPGTIKYESTTIYTSIVNGKNYAIGVGFIGTPTLTIWDVSDQTAPMLTGFINEAGGGAYNCTVGVVSGVQYAFVGYNSGSHFVVFNLTNPYSITQVSNTVVTGSPGSIYGVSFLNGYVYCATQSTGLVVMDVGGGTGSPTAPVQTYQQGSPFKSFGVVAIGTNVYTTYYSTASPYTIRQIISWTLTSPGTAAVPSLLQSLQVPAVGEALGMSVSGNTAFVTTAATGAYNINLVDITTPSSMSNLSTINNTNSFGSAFYAVRSGNILYVPSGGNVTYGGVLDAYDITNRSAPIHIAQATTGNPTSVFGVPALSGGYIFVADYGIVASNNGYLDVFTQVSNTITFGNGVGSSLTVNTLNLSTVQTTYHGSTSGTAVWSMPFQGSSYKKFLIDLLSLTDIGGTITFPTAFTQTPYLYGASASVAVSSASTTTFTLTATTAISGFVFVEGY